MGRELVSAAVLSDSVGRLLCGRCPTIFVRLRRRRVRSAVWGWVAYTSVRGTVDDRAENASSLCWSAVTRDARQHQDPYVAVWLLLEIVPNCFGWYGRLGLVSILAWLIPFSGSSPLLLLRTWTLNLAVSGNDFCHHQKADERQEPPRDVSLLWERSPHVPGTNGHWPASVFVPKFPIGETF